MHDRESRPCRGAQRGHGRELALDPKPRLLVEPVVPPHFGPSLNYVLGAGSLHVPPDGDPRRVQLQEQGAGHGAEARSLGGSEIALFVHDDRVEAQMRVHHVVGHEAHEHEVGLEGQPVVLQHQSLGLREVARDARLDHLDARAVRARRGQAVFQPLQPGVLEVGTDPVGEAVAEGEHAKDPVGLGEGVLVVAKAVAVVAVVVAVLATGAGPLVAAARPRAVGQDRVAHEVGRHLVHGRTQAKHPHAELQQQQAAHRDERQLSGSAERSGPAPRSRHGQRLSRSHASVSIRHTSTQSGRPL